jgi:PhzF family phenazine biosynthesis protein
VITSHQQQRPFAQVDVFTNRPLMGNPVAVVLSSDGLSTEDMHAFTAWTNLSEATFLSAPTTPEADYAVRIFCPGRELPFAGHPTLGSAHAWLEAGGEPKADVIVQECGAGLVRIRRDGGLLSFAAPPLVRSGPLNEQDVERIASGLGLERRDIIDHQWCDNGPGWQAVLVESAEMVRRIRPRADVLAGLDVGVVGFCEAEEECDVEVRAFFPGNQGLVEDPVTGSLNAAIGQWLTGSGQLPAAYVAAQGGALGRAGRVFVERIGDTIWVGGHCMSVIWGTTAFGN